MSTAKYDFEQGRAASMAWRVMLALAIGWMALPAAAQDGDLVWARSMGGTGFDDGRGIAVDAEGNVYTTGWFEGTANFGHGPGSLTLTSVGDDDIFVQKLDSAGNLLWVRSMGGTQRARGQAIAVDAAGNVYTTGIFRGTADFGSIPLTSAGGSDIFVQKLDSAGNQVWARSIGGTGRAQGNGIVVDAAGDVYFTGWFTETVDFDPGPGTFNLTSLASDDDPFESQSDDIFVSKLDSDGNFVWAKSMGNTNIDRGQSIALDDAGNVYTTGFFGGTVDFDPGPGSFNLTSAGTSDIFVQKLDNDGNFVWVRSMGDTGDDYGNGIAVDAAGNVYTTGSFIGTVDFDPGPQTFNLTSPGTDNIFVQKLNSAGDLVWARSMSGTDIDEGIGIVVDAEGNVYTTGWFEGTTDFDPGPGSFPLTAAGDLDIFVQKMSSEGDFAWARSMGGGTGVSRGFGIAVDQVGNVYTTGGFRDTADFGPSLGPGNFTLNSAGEMDIFVQKLDDTGNFVWARSTGGTGDDRGNSVTVDASGNVYITGYFQGTVDFDPGQATFNLTSVGGADIFVQKLNRGGNLVWAQSMGGAGDDHGQSIVVDAAGNSYIAGAFQETADFDPGSGSFNLTSAGSNDIFVVKLDSNGNFVWARSFGDTSNDEVRGIAVDAAGNVYTTGGFLGTVDFDPGPTSFPLTSAGSSDIFVQKLDSDGDFVWARAMGGANFSSGMGIAVDAAGNVYTTGFFGGTVDFSSTPEPFNLASAGAFDIFVQKLDSDGELVWVRAMGGTNAEQGTGIGVDAEGNVYTTGIYRDTADFNPGPETFNLTSAGSWDAFVVKLNNNGNFVWARSTGGAGDDRGLGIAVDPEGNAYTTGWFQGTVDFDPGPGSVNLTSAGNFDIFVQTLDSAGDLVRAQSMGGAGDDRGLGIAVDTVGNIYATGFFNGTADFDPGPGAFNLMSAGSEDIFVVRLAGPLGFPRVPGDVNGDDLVNAVDVQLVINVALGIAIAPTYNADIDSSGTVNAVDVQLVINAALGVDISAQLP